MLRFLRLAVFGAAVLAAGCTNLGYYTQAVDGELHVLTASRPIAVWIRDPKTPPALRARLAEVMRLRAFAVHTLHLPAGGSYLRYADLGRRYVAWNVFAAPELSLRPKRWCFVFAGCVAYRGYFSRARAERYAARLRRAGDDVYVGGVVSYSTLGWLPDPLLSTALDQSLSGVAGLMFHELAHRRLYVRNDTDFDESFAVAVQLEGVKRWLRAQGTPQRFAAYREQLAREREVVKLILEYRARLERLYHSRRNAASKRAAKARAFAALVRDYRALKGCWGGNPRFDGWFAGPLNNAWLAAFGLYYRHVGAFQALLAREHGDLPAFYRAAARLARLPRRRRAAALNALEPGR